MERRTTNVAITKFAKWNGQVRHRNDKSTDKAHLTQMEGQKKVFKEC